MGSIILQKGIRKLMVFYVCLRNADYPFNFFRQYQSIQIDIGCKDVHQRLFAHPFLVCEWLISFDASRLTIPSKAAKGWMDEEPCITNSLVCGKYVSTMHCWHCGILNYTPSDSDESIRIISSERFHRFFSPDVSKSAKSTDSIFLRMWPHLFYCWIWTHFLFLFPNPVDWIISCLWNVPSFWLFSQNPWLYPPLTPTSWKWMILLIPRLLFCSSSFCLHWLHSKTCRVKILVNFKSSTNIWRVLPNRLVTENQKDDEVFFWICFARTERWLFLPQVTGNVYVKKKILHLQAPSSIKFWLISKYSRQI